MIPIEQQISCIKRELALREAVYPKRVESGKMKPEEARRQIETMREVLRTLERVKDETAATT